MIVLGLVSNTPPLAAADSEMTQEYLTCMDKSNGNTAGMTDCISAETARQDARLNENYKRIVAKLSAKRKNTLQVAQRAWVKFSGRELQFLFRSGGRHGRAFGRQGLLSAGNGQSCKRAKKSDPMNGRPGAIGGHYSFIVQMWRVQARIAR